MDTRHYKMIVEVARQGNLTKAAQTLCVTQSALSHQLKEVESTFQARLFRRSKRKMELTSQGKLVLTLCEEVLTSVDEAKKKVLHLNDANSGEIRITTQCHLAYAWLSSFLKEFQRIYPRVDVEILPEATYHSVQYLLERKIDLAITDEALNKKLKYYPLFKDEFVVVVSPDHAWSKLKWVDPALFLEETYLMYDVSPESSTVYQHVYGKQRPKKLYRFRMTEVIIEMVKANRGIAVLPNWVVLPYLHSGELAVLPLGRKGLKRTWYAAMLPNMDLNFYTKDFLRLLARHLKRSEALVVG